MISINRSKSKIVNSALQSEVIIDLSKVPIDTSQLRFTLPECKEDIVFVLNAAILGQLGLTSDISFGKLIETFSVNFFSYVQLINEVTKIAGAEGVLLHLVLIDTGAVYKDIPGWCPYSLSKRSLSDFCDFVAAESSHVRVSRFNPGIFDSEMQQIIHSHSKAATEIYRSKNLSSPEIPARQLVSELDILLGKTNLN